MSSKARKIPEELENPIDNILIELAEKLNPYFYKLGFNPNGVTTLSLIFGILSCYFYYLKYYLFSSISMFISYFFDVMDGNFARRYNMQTQFGDYYDHIKDTIVLFTITYLILTNKDLSFSLKILGFIVGLFFLFGSITHLGCIEQYVKKSNSKKNIKESKFLSGFQQCCQNLSKIKQFRYFGTGTSNIFLSFFILIPKFLPV